MSTGHYPILVRTTETGGLRDNPICSVLLPRSCLRGISLAGDPRAQSAVWRRQLKRRTCPSVKTLARERTVTRSSLDTGGSPGGSIREPFGLGGTRLKRIIQNGSNSVAVKFNKSRKKFPSKILLLLLGYYSANALATVLGQTGDWDILAAGVMVAVVEGVGYLLYRMPPFLGERGKEVVALANYYKLGFSFGLFVDAFKLGS